ncbi:MAG: hypothetical protein ACI88A_000821 [Paraglaciecola sp.]|jgi:hypothetical protein
MKLANKITCCAMLVSLQAFGWGQTGHRVTGAIAEQYLNPKAKTAIAALLPNEDLAEASTYADEMRADPSVFWQSVAGPFHYVTVPKGKVYKDLEAPEQGDAVSALSMFSAQVKSPNTSLEQKQRALRFIVHIIGDLHQPLHAGNGNDRGGNDIKLSFFWEDSNLHRVWDSGMIDHRQLSYTEWTARLSRKITPEQAKLWMVADPLVWIAESSKIRDEIYPAEEKISWDYLHQHIPTATTRIQMAGMRIAAYLNGLFAK